MRVATFVALFCLVAFSAAETLKSSRLRGYHSFNGPEINDATFMQLKETSFGKNLFSMLSLKYKSTGRLDRIIELLDKLSSDIKDQQDKEDTEYAAETKRLNGIITAKRAEIKAAEEEIKKLLAEQKQKTKERDAAVALKGQREAELAQREKDLDEATKVRKHEHQEFLDRKAAQEGMIAGIDAVVKFFNDNLVGNKELDAQAVNTILDELKDLRSTLTNSIESDTKADAEQEADYQDFKTKQEARIAFLKKDIIRLTNKIAALNKRLAEIIVELGQQRAIIKAAEEVIATTEAAIKTLNTRYAHNKKVRQEQQQLIDAVKARLTKNPKGVQQYLNKA